MYAVRGGTVTLRRPPPNVTGRLVPGTSDASPGALASATEAAPMTSGVSVLRALATRMRTFVPPSETRTRLRTVTSVGPPLGDPVGEAPQAAIQAGVAAEAGPVAHQATTRPARAAAALVI